jgi:hypothetical protein
MEQNYIFLGCLCALGADATPCTKRNGPDLPGRRYLEWRDSRGTEETTFRRNRKREKAHGPDYDALDAQKFKGSTKLYGRPRAGPSLAQAARLAAFGAALTTLLVMAVKFASATSAACLAALCTLS